MFKVIFSNNHEIVFEDVIELNCEQKGQILQYAESYHQEEIHNKKHGLKLKLEFEQENIVIDTKNTTLAGKTTVEIHQNQIVQFTKHSIDRMIQRFKGDQLNAYLSVIDMLKKCSEINNLAEWKGFKSLSYTFIDNDKIQKKIVAVFVNVAGVMKIITVMNDEAIDEMDYRISEDPKISEKLLKLRNQLKRQYKS